MSRSLPIYFFIIVLVLCGCREAKRYHDENPDIQKEAADLLSEIRQFQKELNDSFYDPDLSPLSEKERTEFKGLEFFEADTNFRVLAQLHRTPESMPFLMPTTTERKSTERVYGIARFKIAGQEFELEVYQNLELLEEEGYENYLFLPFTDNTNGNSTYAGGRYIDLEIPPGDELLIDFNRSYNPYCVYNEKYSCPIVPKVNDLDTEILAGIKNYNKKSPD